MLICKYTRLRNAVFVPHLDLLRAVTMGVRRAGIDASYSEGFNPHMKIFFGQPLPLGVESECEYFCIHTGEQPREFMRKMNSSLPEGVRILAAAAVEKDPNVANIMAFADYTVTMRDVVPQMKDMMTYCNGSECIIEYEAKGEKKVKDVASMIVSAESEKDRVIKLRLACGNVNLRADRLVKYLSDKYSAGCGFDVLKTATFDRNFVNLDKIFFGSAE